MLINVWRISIRCYQSYDWLMIRWCGELPNLRPRLQEEVILSIGVLPSLALSSFVGAAVTQTHQTRFSNYYKNRIYAANFLHFY